MINCKISDLSKIVRGLTQAHYTTSNGDVLSVAQPSAPIIFTRTLMASVSGDFLFEVGNGKLDAVIHTRLLVQYASDTSQEFNMVADDYKGLLASLGYSKDVFRRVVAGIMGSSERSLTTKTLPQVPPTFVFKLLQPLLPVATSDILVHMVTDYVCHMLMPLGMILPDAPYVYCLRRTGYFPTFKALVNVIEAADLQRVIQCLADADLSLVKTAMDAKGAILPAMISQHLASAVVMAHETSLGSYEADSVVISTLSVIGAILDPSCPVPLQPRERLRNHPVISELRSNLAIFLAYQNMVATGTLPDVRYSDEEMTSVILPLFNKALAELSPFAVRILDDVISHLGKRTTRNHLGIPGNIVLFEDWDFGSEIAAFSRKKQTATGNQCFLTPVVPVSVALTTAMRPIRSHMSMSALVERRIATYEMAASSSRVPVDGTNMSLAFPSLIENELRMNLPVGTISKLIVSGVTEENLKDPLFNLDDAQQIMARQIAFDYYALVMHIAVSRNPSVSISYGVNELGRIPYVVWDLETNFREPISSSAIISGRVITTEPLEVLAYVPDFISAGPRTARVLPIEDYRHALHLWDWHSASTKLDLNPSYPTTIRNTNYLVELDEHEMLNLGSRRTNVRFIRPLMASAIVRVWMMWLIDDRSFIDEQIRSTKDILVNESFKGRRIRSAMEIAQMLISIGASGTGANSARRISRKLAAAMFSQGNIDDYDELHQGIQRQRLHIWAGLATLQLLGLITVDDATSILTYLSESDAMSMMIGMESYIEETQ